MLDILTKAGSDTQLNYTCNHGSEENHWLRIINKNARIYFIVNKLLKANTLILNQDAIFQIQSSFCIDKLKNKL